MALFCEKVFFFDLVQVCLRNRNSQFGGSLVVSAKSFALSLFLFCHLFRQFRHFFLFVFLSLLTTVMFVFNFMLLRLNKSNFKTIGLKLQKKYKQLERLSNIFNSVFH